MTSPVIQSQTTVAGATSTSVSLAKPTGLVNGELLVAVYYLEAAGVVTMPTGFANIADYSGSGGANTTRIRIDWKTADGTEPGTLTWTVPNTYHEGVLLRITGNGGAGLEQTNGSNNSLQQTQPPNVALAGNVSSDALVILAGANFTGGAAWSAPAAWTLVWNSGDSLGVASINQASGGAPATNHVVFGGSGTWSVTAAVTAVKSPNPVHTGLTGHGQINLSLTGAAHIQLTAMPNLGTGRGWPMRYFNVGDVCWGNSNGARRNYYLEHSDELVIPDFANPTILYYSFEPGVTATITELTGP